jgi:hypothetical protein
MHARKLLSVQYSPQSSIKKQIRLPQKDDPIALCTNKCISLHWRGKHVPRLKERNNRVYLPQIAFGAVFASSEGE